MTIYALGYALSCLSNIIKAIRRGYSLWVVALVVLVFGAGLLGIYYFLTDLAPPFTLRIWKAVFVAIVVGHLTLLGINAYELTRGRSAKPALVFGEMFVSIMLLFPSFVINYELAFCR